jgi:hypothetical protein
LVRRRRENNNDRGVIGCGYRQRIGHFAVYDSGAHINKSKEVQNKIGVVV